MTTVLLAVPSQTLRENLEKWAPLVTPGATLVSLAKGIELGTLMRMSQVIIQVTGVDPVRWRCSRVRIWPVRSLSNNPRPRSSPARIPAVRSPCSAD